VVTQALAVEGGLVLAALALGWLLGQPPLAQIDWPMHGTWLGLLATLTKIAALGLVTHWPLGPFADLDDVVQRPIVPVFRHSTILDLALIAALAGLGEEMLFRGVAQSGIEGLSGSAWMALALASLLFGLAHPITLAYAVLAGLIGVYLGWLLLATDNLLVPIVTHAAYDFAALLYLIYGNSEPQDIPDTAQTYGDDWSI
jgi:membrane protease YdiL (CAAX protease family)